MPLLAGVDGCGGGWICVYWDTATPGAAHARLFHNAAALLNQHPAPAVLAIDVPIGLVDGGARPCDSMARELLGDRRSCVFEAPVRPALTAPTYLSACATALAHAKRKIAKQAWNIHPQVRDVDAVVTPLHQRWVFEVHPELSFRAMNAGVAMRHSKQTAEGRDEREQLIARHFGPTTRARVREGLDEQLSELTTRLSSKAKAWSRRDLVGEDDLTDAFAALWSARRIHEGKAERLPEEAPPLDSRGLRMEMWF